MSVNFRGATGKGLGSPPWRAARIYLREGKTKLRRATGQDGSWLRRGRGPAPGESQDVFERGHEAVEVVPEETEGQGEGLGRRADPQARRAVATRQDARGEGQGNDSYLDEHFHVHERLGQDGETGAQEHLTGRVRHDGTRGRTDGQTESPSDTAGSRSRVRGAGFTGQPAARSPAQAPPTAPPKETAGAREGTPGAGL